MHTSNLILALALLLATSTSHAEVVRYTLDIFYMSGAPDGVYKSKMFGINGQFPGPTLEANVGDTLEITVINNIQDGQNTSIHWHGIIQKGTVFQDGTAGFTQCPLPAGESMVYRFQATQAGTFWYHSHVNSQYTEGLYGALIIHGKPEAYQYDGEVTLLLGDWYHATAWENEKEHLDPENFGAPPTPVSALINGMGRYPCDKPVHYDLPCDSITQTRPVFKIQRDKIYRFRIINAAALAGFNVSIDGIDLHVIEADGMDVASPVEAEVLEIYAGQRYSFLMKCPQTPEDELLLRVNVEQQWILSPWFHHPFNNLSENLMPDMSVVIQCVDEDLSQHKNLVVLEREQFTYEDMLPPKTRNETANYLNEMDLRPRDGVSAPDYFDKEFILDVNFSNETDGIRRSSFNQTPFLLPDDKPILWKVLNGEKLPERTLNLEIEAGDVVQIVINNMFLGPHPFHLHGHHFWVLATGQPWDEEYNRTEHELNLNGVKRDTMFVHHISYAVIRFVADNPGTWAFHCHIDWHNFSGMGLVFVEGKEELRREAGIPAEAERVCQLHEKRREQEKAYQKHKYSRVNERRKLFPV